MSAAIAPEQTLSAMANEVVRVALAVCAANSPGPAGGDQRRFAACFGAKAAKELGQRHAGLEPGSVEGHVVRSAIGRACVARQVAHWVSLAEAGYQSADDLTSGCLARRIALNCLRPIAIARRCSGLRCPPGRQVCTKRLR